MSINTVPAACQNPTQTISVVHSIFQLETLSPSLRETVFYETAARVLAVLSLLRSVESSTWQTVPQNIITNTGYGFRHDVEVLKTLSLYEFAPEKEFSSAWMRTYAHVLDDIGMQLWDERADLAAQSAKTLLLCGLPYLDTRPVATALSILYPDGIKETEDYRECSMSRPEHIEFRLDLHSISAVTSPVSDGTRVDREPRDLSENLSIRFPTDVSYDKREVWQILPKVLRSKFRSLTKLTKRAAQSIDASSQVLSDHPDFNIALHRFQRDSALEKIRIALEPKLGTIEAQIRNRVEEMRTNGLIHRSFLRLDDYVLELQRGSKINRSPSQARSKLYNDLQDTPPWLSAFERGLLTGMQHTLRDWSLVDPYYTDTLERAGFSDLCQLSSAAVQRSLTALKGLYVCEVLAAIADSTEAQASLRDLCSCFSKRDLLSHHRPYKVEPMALTVASAFADEIISHGERGGMSVLNDRLSGTHYVPELSLAHNRSQFDAFLRSWAPSTDLHCPIDILELAPEQLRVQIEFVRVDLLPKLARFSDCFGDFFPELKDLFRAKTTALALLTIEPEQHLKYLAQYRDKDSSRHVLSGAIQQILQIAHIEFERESQQPNCAESQAIYGKTRILSALASCLRGASLKEREDVVSALLSPLGSSIRRDILRLSKDLTEFFPGLNERVAFLRRVAPNYVPDDLGNRVRGHDSDAIWEISNRQIFLEDEKYVSQSEKRDYNNAGAIFISEFIQNAFETNTDLDRHVELHHKPFMHTLRSFESNEKLPDEWVRICMSHFVFDNDPRAPGSRSFEPRALKESIYPRIRELLVLNEKREDSRRISPELEAFLRRQGNRPLTDAIASEECSEKRKDGCVACEI